MQSAFAVTLSKSRTHSARFSGSVDWPKFKFRNLRIFFLLAESAADDVADDVDDDAAVGVEDNCDNGDDVDVAVSSYKEKNSD